MTCYTGKKKYITIYSIISNKIHKYNFKYPKDILNDYTILIKKPLNYYWHSDVNITFALEYKCFIYLRPNTYFKINIKIFSNIVFHYQKNKINEISVETIPYYNYKLIVYYEILIKRKKQLSGKFNQISSLYVQKC